MLKLVVSLASEKPLFPRGTITFNAMESTCLNLMQADLKKAISDTSFAIIDMKFHKFADLNISVDKNP